MAMFGAGTSVSTVPKQVAFGEDGDVVVAGSDTGSVYVFRKTGGGPEQVLTNASGGYTQIVAVSWNP